MTNMLSYTFGNSAALLRQSGYIPVPLADCGQPMGPVMVRQHDHSKWPENDPLAVGVLTWVPAPRSEYDPVQNPAAVRLATLIVKVSDALVSDVDAIIARHVGSAKCPVRIADDGSLQYVFRLTGEPFPTVQTRRPADDSDRAAVESGPSWIPLNGTWRDGVDLLDIRRSDLPEISKTVADALVSEIDKLLSDRAPRWEPQVYVKRPLLQPGERLVYSNSRALDKLRENGWNGLVPVAWGQQHAENRGFSDSNGWWHYNVDVSEHGIAVRLGGDARRTGLVAIERVSGKYRDDVDEVIRSFGPCLVRSVVGDDTRRVYLFRGHGGKDESVYQPTIHTIVRRGLVVLSGADFDHGQYVWDCDLLTARIDDLGTLESHDLPRLQRALEALPTDCSKPAGKRARKTGT